MQIDLVCIGKIKEPYLRDGIFEYQKRLSGFLEVRITESPEEKVRESASVKEILSASLLEGRRLMDICTSASAGLIIALDPAGKKISSFDLAVLFKKLEIDGPHHIAILIGGPYGLSDDVRKKANILLSLSDMTFTHQMARLLILEQIYRAFTINRGLPYHR